MKIISKKMSKGFTLLEMLVVVLIIGILAGIALPQYQLSVEKARSAEALMNLATIKRQMQLYITANGLPTSSWINYKDFATVDLSGGEWNGDNSYHTKFFRYGSGIDSEGVNIEISREKDDYYTILCTQYEMEGYNDDTQMGDGWFCSCITQSNDFGRKMCKSIYEPLGFKYVDNDY